MKTFLIIVGIIAAIVILLIVGLITASKRIEKKNKKSQAEMEMANSIPKEKQHLLAYGANLSLYRSESPRILQVKVDSETLKEGLLQPGTLVIRRRLYKPWNGCLRKGIVRSMISFLWRCKLASLLPRRKWGNRRNAINQPKK